MVTREVYNSRVTSSTIMYNYKSILCDKFSVTREFWVSHVTQKWLALTCGVSGAIFDCSWTTFAPLGALLHSFWVPLGLCWMPWDPFGALLRLVVTRELFYSRVTGPSNGQYSQIFKNYMFFGTPNGSPNHLIFH